MKFKSGIILILFIFYGCRLSAQTIVAGIEPGTDSVKVTFSLSPAVPSGTAVSWNFGNGKTSSGVLSPIVFYDQPGKYTVTCLINNITTISGIYCVPVDAGFIKMYNGPGSNFSYKDSLEIDPNSYVFRHIRLPDETVQESYDWRFMDMQGNIMANYNTSSVFYQFEDTGSFNVRLITSFNVCADTTSRTIGVAEPYIISNVFTPNNDAINDFFQVRTDGSFTHIFSVYTRSGVLVYRSKSPNIIWDGRSFSGQELTAGIYYYTIESPAIEPRNGFVYLIREK